MSRAQDLFDRLVSGGNAEVLAFIAEPVTEELFLEYKRSAGNGAGTSLNNKDRANLAKAISCFGNSEGGVIVWGVDCRSDPIRGDVPSASVPISNPSRFKSWLEQATTGLTIPPHTGVRHHAIAEGFVVSLIPSGIHAPYQNVGDLSYYIRSGSNFAKAPHAVLAGKFGRRPQSAIKHHFFVSKMPVFMPDRSVKTQAGLMIRNYGRGIAEDIFVNVGPTCHSGKECKITFKPSDDGETWSGRYLLNQQVQMMTRPGIRLAPEADLMPVSIDMTLRLPIERDFALSGVCGCAGGEPWRFEFRAEKADLAAAYTALFSTPQGSDAEAAAEVFNKLVFKTLTEQSG